MPSSESRRFSPARVWCALAAVLVLATAPLSAQIPSGGQQLPTPDQAQELLRNQPQMIDQLSVRLQQSALTPDQVRSRLRAAGYPENILDD